MEGSNKLKIGISTYFQYSFFSNGAPTTAISIADAITKLGHIAILVNMNEKKEWYDDCESLREKYEIRNMAQWKENGYDQLDILVDIDGFIVPSARRNVSKKVVVFIRKPTHINEIEKSVYPIQGPVRNILDCDAIWTWEEFGEQDAHILELLSSKPVYRIPFTWSPSPIISYENDGVQWLEVSKATPPEFPWECHITESNASITNNSTLPIVIVSNVKSYTDFPMQKYHIHNSQNIEKEAFFKENVYEHCVRANLNAIFTGRQRITDWKALPKSFVVSHIRFLTIKPYLLDCVWNGIPLIHNSPLLRDIGCGLERLYYNDNSVVEATNAVMNMNTDYMNSSGIFAPGQLYKIRFAIQEKMNPCIHREVWESAIRGTVNTIYNPKRTLKIGFSDLWQDANHNYNFWTLLLQEACKHLPNPPEIVGVEITERNINEPIDMLFFAPFGDVWKKVSPSIPKVHITGENTPAIESPGVFLNLGFQKTDAAKGVYRFPLWIQYLDWFGADQNRLRNPRSIPVDSIASPNEDIIDKKTKFCAFIVSNPSNSLRNNAFHWLNTYKRVDSAGRLFNNVGDVIFVQNAGGGGGEIKKYEFLKDYKFCITFENSRGDGYVTEKLLAAKAAGCVPIYWGAEDVCEDFVEGSFLNANGVTSKEELVELVKRLDEDDVAWKECVMKSSVHIENVQKKLSEVAKLVLSRLLSAEELSLIPESLGTITKSSMGYTGGNLEKKSESDEVVGLLDVPLENEEELDAHGETSDITLTNTEWNQKILLVTYATQRFIPSLKLWIGSAEAQRRANANISIRVYLGRDVDKFHIYMLRTEHPDVTFLRLPSDSVRVEGFADLWEPQHFAWKLWIYNQLAREVALENVLVWYADAGSIIVRMPIDWFKATLRNDVCVLEDSEQKNDQWCHQKFCELLKVTKGELSQYQIVGGIMAFIPGSKKAIELFSEAWKYAQIRDVIVGKKWEGTLPDGRPFGHRHDQSILSILRIRHKICTFPLSQVYNHTSLRRTFKSGGALYVHRGTVVEHENFTERIGEVHLINLARRPDRITRFRENHGPWIKNVCLRPAFDGKNIKLTPNIARLFAPNDFFWKKAVMGCALSHLSLWAELVQEKPCVENYLILEDDVKLASNWLSIWEKAAKCIPKDYDVLYLGGVLPPNRKVFQDALVSVNECWSKVAPNIIFGQKTPSTYFHFCNYAYILSRSGAEKIIKSIAEHGGIYTSADHMICNRIDILNHYVLNPIVAGCYQDDDPKYATSAFNDFSRVDSFDSDLWNNDERFSKEEVETNIQKLSDKEKIPVIEALQEAQPSTKKLEPPTRFYSIDGVALKRDSLLEYSWLEELFGEAFIRIDNIAPDHTPLDTHPIFIVLKDSFVDSVKMFQVYEEHKKPFSVIHLSDEHPNNEEYSDYVDWYSLSMCKKILRPYPRQNVPCPEKVTTIPLGYCKKRLPTTNIADKTLVWSFVGTDWFHRKERLEPWLQVTPNKCIFFDKWMDESQLSAKEYSELCGSSLFIPCMRGQSSETFRLWEALEHGAIPIYVREPDDGEFYEMVTKHIPIMSLPSWVDAIEYVVGLLKHQDLLIAYRNLLLKKWLDWKKELKETCQAFLQN